MRQRHYGLFVVVDRKLCSGINCSSKGVKNINVVNLFIVSNKTVETFDIVQKTCIVIV